MSNKPTGGPAFPQFALSRAVNPEGMTLRDYFAGQALANGWRSMFEDSEATYEVIAACCYEMADAMLQEREG